MSTFWSQMAEEPKRQHRWYVGWGSNNGLMQQLRFAAKKVSKPSYKITPTTHKYLNHMFNFPGRQEWNDITIDFASVTIPDGTGLVNAMSALAGYNIPSSEYDVKTMSKQKFDSALGSMTITQINADGTPIEVWQLDRCFFTDVKFGDLDYGGEEILTISVTVKYDWATLKVGAEAAKTAGTP